MILSFAVLFGLVAALFFLPIKVFLLTALYCYAMLNLWRVYTKNVTMLDLAVLAIYMVIAALYSIFGIKDIVPFTGSIFYGAIGLTSLVGGLIGRPFTLGKIGEKPKSQIILHRIMNVILGIFYMVALYFSIALFPVSTYIVVPLVISIVAIPMSMISAKRGIYLFARYSEVRRRRNGEYN
jgi:hypothetical protein